MGKLSIVSAAAILVSAAALPSMVQAQCAAQDPTCATNPMPKQDSNATKSGNPANARAEATGAESRSHLRHHRAPPPLPQTGPNDTSLGNERE